MYANFIEKQGKCLNEDFAWHVICHFLSVALVALIDDAYI